MANELEKTNGKGLVVNFDKFMPEDYTTNMDASDVILPRLKLVHGMTRGKGDAKDGDWINSVTGKNFGEKIEIVTIYHWKPRILFEGQKMRCRSFDGKVGSSGEYAGTVCSKCPNSPWVEETPPKCSLIYAYAVAELNELMDAIKNNEILPPLVLSMSKSATATAKMINSNILSNETRKIPMFVNRYELMSTVKTSGGNDYLIPTVKIQNTIKEIVTVKYLVELYRNIRSMKIDISAEDVGQGEKVITPEASGASSKEDTGGELSL